MSPASPRASLLLLGTLLLALPGAAWPAARAGAAARAAPSGVPQLEHVVVVIMENKTYDQVRAQPFTASLIANGASFSNSHGVTHPSQPNYLALWAGTTFGVTTNDCPAPGSPYVAANLGQACEAAGLTWAAYCENLPSAGWSGCEADGWLYARKHAPWPNFMNLDHANERPFADLAVAESTGTLPSLVFVVPNQCNDTHNAGCTVAMGDAWLATHVPAMQQAAGPRGLVILTWDEDDYSSDNHILTVFSGPLVASGSVSSGWVDHYTVLRTICDGLGLAPIGAAADESPITDVWTPTGVGGEPRPFALDRVRPNPSLGSVAALLTLPTRMHVVADVYDLAGRHVARLLDAAREGPTTLQWDGRRTDGRRAARGAYVLRVRADAAALERRFTLGG